MKKLILVFSPFAILLSSCGIPRNIAYNSRDVSGYVPTVANVNCNTEKGHVQVNPFVGFNHVELLTNYNISDHLYVQANTFLSGFYKNYDGAIGYTTPIKKTSFFTTNAIGYGYGHMNLAQTKTLDLDDNVMKIRKTNAHYDLNRIYLQSTIGINAEDFSFSLGGRLNLLYYTNYDYRTYSYSTIIPYTVPPGIHLANKSSQVLDVFTTWRLNRDQPINWYLQCLFSVPLNAADQHNQHHLINRPDFPLLSAGLNINLNFKKKTQ